MSDSIWSAHRDEDLVRLAVAGEAQAFGELAQRYRPAMLALAERYVGRNSGAEDVVQDSLLLAHRSLGSLRNPSRVAAWLHAVTRRRATLYLRGAKRVTPHADMEPFLVDRSDMPATGADVVVTRVATYAALVTLYARTNRNALSSNPRGVTAWIDFGIKTWI